MHKTEYWCLQDPELIAVYFYAQRMKHLGTFPSKITLLLSFCLSHPRMGVLYDQKKGNAWKSILFNCGCSLLTFSPDNVSTTLSYTQLGSVTSLGSCGAPRLQTTANTTQAFLCGAWDCLLDWFLAQSVLGAKCAASTLLHCSWCQG